MSNFWGILLTLLVFLLALRLKEEKFFNKIPPTVMTGTILIGIIYFFKLDYSEYNKSACILTIL